MMQEIRHKTPSALKSMMTHLQPQMTRDPVLIHLRPQMTHVALQHMTQANPPLQVHLEAGDRLLEHRRSRPDPMWHKLNPVWLKILLHILHKDQDSVTKRYFQTQNFYRWNNTLCKL
jgi:hypothetical protein